MKFLHLQFFKKYWPKITSIFLFILLSLAYANIFAVFTPGQTLDPNCAPGAVGCTVDVSSTETDPLWSVDKPNYSTKIVADSLYLGSSSKASDADTLDGHDTSYFQTALGFTPYNSTNPNGYVSDGNTGWDNSYGFITGITSGNVTTALGFTPYNATNPNGYITGITSGNVTTALGFTPYNSTNPAGYISSYTETDPGVSAWAKAAVKPTYTASEVGLGNVPNLSFSGSNTGDETNATIKTKLGTATTSVDGYLTSTDWNTFNNKQPAGSYLTGTKVDSFNTRTGAVTLTSSDVTTALTYTPYNSTNPSGYISGITSGNVTTALGYTPYNSTNPAGYISSYTETDPSVSAWAKAALKPSYIWTEIGSRPTALSAFTNDLGNYGGFLTSYTETDPTISLWAKAGTKPTYTASEVGLGNVTNESKATMFTSPTFTGTVSFADLSITGNIIPTVNNTYNLGSPTNMWHSFYVGPGSIYVDGQKVLQTDISDSVVVSSDVNQNLILKTSGTGNIEINPSGTGQILLKSDVTLTGGKAIRTSNSTPVILSDGLSTPSITTSVLNGGISIAPNGIGNTYIIAGNFGILNTAPGELLTLGTAGTTAGKLSLAGATSGKAILQVPAVAGTPTLTLPTSTGTLALLSDIPGVTGYIPYTGATTDVNLGTHSLTVDTNSLFVDSVNHKVGIGTTTPGYKLDVNGSTNISTGSTYNIGDTRALTMDNTLSNLFVGNSGNLSTTGVENFGFGQGALSSLTDGTGNIGLGTYALRFTTRGTNNTAIGSSALQLNVLGHLNTGIGILALYRNLSSENTAIGSYALRENISGTQSTALGAYAGLNSTGSQNVFIGNQAGRYELGSNKLIIDSIDRTTEALGRSSALIYGITDATPANQILSLGGGGNVGIGTMTPISLLDILGTNSPTGPKLFSATSSRNGVIFAIENDGHVNTTGNITASILAGNTIQTTSGYGSLTNTAAVVNLFGWDGITLKVYEGEVMRITRPGNIGIGTASPGLNNRLKIVGTDDTSSNYSLVAGGSTTTGLVVRNDGNVGIGTNSPASNFQVSQSTTGVGTVTVSGTSVGGVGTQFTNTFKVGDTITVTTTSGSETKAITTITSDTVLVTAAFAGTAAAGTAYTLAGGDRFAVKGNGYVGIGTMNPTANLDIHNMGILRLGTTNLESYTTLQTHDSQGFVINTNYVGTTLAFNNASIAQINSTGMHIGGGKKIYGESDVAYLDLVEGGSANTKLWNTWDRTISFGTNNLERMRITGSGNVGIGTTNPITPLEIPGNTTNSSAKFGTFEIQSYATNNGWLTDNDYYDGTNFKYRNNGYAAQMRFLYGALQLEIAPSGLAGETVNFIKSAQATLSTGGLGQFLVNAGNAGTWTNFGVNPPFTKDDFASSQLNPINATTKVLVVQGATSQIANLQEWQDSTGAALTVVDENGNIGIGTTNPLQKLDLVAGSSYGYNGLPILRAITGYNDLFIGNAGNMSASSSTGGNVAIGNSAMSALTSGYQNVAVGFNSLLSLTEGTDNFALGSYALSNITNQNSNVAIGSTTGQFVTGSTNTFIGTSAGRFNHASDSIGIGASALAGTNNTTGAVVGFYNIAIGNTSSLNMTSGERNVSIGWASLQANTTGSYNTAIGMFAGYNTIGSSNVFIGNEQGKTDRGSNKLFIDVTDRADPLIWGDFSNRYVNFNGSVGIGIASPIAGSKLDVNGIINANNFMTLDLATGGSSNTFIGTRPLNNTASYNTLIGVQAGNSITSGGYNSMLGYQAGYYLTEGSNNFLLGVYAGRSITTSSSNVAIGNSAGYNLTTGTGGNTLIGNSAGLTFTNERRNTAIGSSAGILATGEDNVLVGFGAGQKSTGQSVILGAYAGAQSTGNHNTIIGWYANYGNTGAGSNNVILGNDAGYYESGSNTLIIDNALRSTEALGRSSALLYGLFNANPANQILSLGGGGNVGIGTTSPTSILALGGTTARTIQMERNTTAATAGQGLTLSSGGAIIGTADLAGGDLNLKSGTSTGTGTSAMRFFTATAGSTSSADNIPTEKMTILGNGNVGIGKTNPGYKLDVGNSSVSGIVSRFENSTGTCDINPTTSSLSCSSDINLKKNITNVKDNKEFVLQTLPDLTEKTTLEKITYLTPVNYNWKKNEKDGDIKHIGFIAQEMEQIFPDLVSTDPVTGLKSISYANITPYIVEAVQEMNLKMLDLTSLDTTKATSLGSLIKTFLADEYNRIDKIFAKTVVTEGLEMKDSATGETYCVMVTNGDINKVKGKCGEPIPAASQLASVVNPSPTPEEIEAARVAKIDTDLADVKAAIATKVEIDYTPESWLLFIAAKDIAMLLPEVVESQTPAQTPLELETNKISKTQALNDAIILLVPNTPPLPTCTDGIMNQDETEVDVGGVCTII